MKNFFKKKPKYKKTDSRNFATRMLKKPNSQITEALYELIANYKEGMTRKDFMLQCDIQNAPQVIKRLRHKGCDIICNEVQCINKFGREISYGNYLLWDLKNALTVYEKLNPSEIIKST